MALKLILVLVSLSIWTSSAQKAADNRVTTINTPETGANWVMGTTLDSNFDSGYPSPFTDESVAAFIEAWNARRDGKPQSNGKFSFEGDIVTSNEEKIDILDISASLSLSYMFFSVCFQ